MDLRWLRREDAAAYRATMLQAYRHVDGEFTSTVADREALPLEWWCSRLGETSDAPERVLGAFASDELVGVAGIRIDLRQRTRHQATLFGMFVLPQFSGRGLGGELIQRVLEAARATSGVRIVRLTVTETNQTAIRLYESCGFEAWGVEAEAIRVGEELLGKVHMALPLRHGM